VREELRESALGKALVAPVAPGDVLSAPACVATFDLATMAPADADFTARFRLQSAAGEVRGSRGAARLSVPNARYVRRLLSWHIRPRSACSRCRAQTARPERVTCACACLAHADALGLHAHASARLRCPAEAVRSLPAPGSHKNVLCSPARGAQEATCHALLLWFDADFSARVCAAAPVRLSTSPLGEPTHWAQAVLALRHPVALGPAGAPQVAAALRAAPGPPDGQAARRDAAGPGEPGAGGRRRGPGRAARAHAPQPGHLAGAGGLRRRARAGDDVQRGDELGRQPANLAPALPSASGRGAQGLCQCVHAHLCGEGAAHCAGPLTAGALSGMFPVCRIITHKTPVDLERPGITSSICFKLWERLSHSTSSCIGLACSQAALLHQQQSEPATEVLPVRRIWCLYGVPLLAKQWFGKEVDKAFLAGLSVCIPCKYALSGAMHSAWVPTRNSRCPKQCLLGGCGDDVTPAWQSFTPEAQN